MNIKYWMMRRRIKNESNEISLEALHREEASYLEVTALLICNVTQITLSFSSNCCLIRHENVEVGRAFVERKMKVVLTLHSLVNKGFKQLDRGFSLLEGYEFAVKFASVSTFSESYMDNIIS